jgi:hypothetical protein
MDSKNIQTCLDTHISLKVLMKYLKDNSQSMENPNFSDKILKLVQRSNKINKENTINNQEYFEEDLNGSTSFKLNKNTEITLQIPLNESYLDKIFFKRISQKSALNPNKKAKSFKLNVKL